MFNINFKDYFWGNCNELHERYHLKKITLSNITELFTRLQESMSNYAKELNSLITKDYILYPEKYSSKYDAMEFIKLILTIQSTQLNVGVEIIKKRILETLKIEKEEEMVEKELFNDLKKNINKYEESKLNLSKIKEKFYQSAKSAENAIRQAKEYALKEKDNSNLNHSNNYVSNNSNNNINNENNETLIKLEQKYLECLLEARKNDEKYMEILKETNNYREIVNSKQSDLLKFYENIENKDHQLYDLLLRDFYSFLKTDNSVMKGNLIQFEDKINKINYNNDIIALINIYGSEKKPEKKIKYNPYTPDLDNDKYSDDNELTLNYQIIMAMKPFIKDLCPNFNIELESQKQEMREISQRIINNNENIIFSEDDKTKMLNYINEEWGQKYFLYYLSKLRSSGNFCQPEQLIKFLAEILKKILSFADKNLDYETAKNCIILSQTYYYEEKNTSRKIYLVELISENKWLKMPEFWRNIIDVNIKEDIKKINELNENSEKLTKKVYEQSIINIVFGQVISYINNMKDFKIEDKIIVKIVDEFVEKYKIGKELSNHIYENISNEKEVEKLREEYKSEIKDKK